MPKNFSQPLTCFYWHTYGTCKKSDESCLYAHYPTGVVAAAPVSLGGGKGPIAGRNATAQLDDQAEREKQFQDREAMLRTKEMELNGRLAAVSTTNHDETWLERILELVANGKASAGKAQNVLVNTRERLSNFRMFDDPDAPDHAVKAIEEAAIGVCRFDADLELLRKQAEESLSKSSDLSEPSRAFL